MQFFTRLNYSFGNEDWETEQKALKIKSSDRVLCITASGDRPLHLLLNECKEVVALDANRLQNHLLALKMAAMQELKFPEYLAFLGATHCTNRIETFYKIASFLDEESRQFWQNNLKKIKSGILYQGVVEKFTHSASYFVRFMRGAKVHRLFSFTDINEQKDFIKKEWNTYLWRQCFHLGMNPLISRYLINDPGLKSTTSKLNVGAYFYNRMENLLNTHLARESSLLSLFLKGKVSKDAFPPYLKENGCKIIKKRLDKISFQHKDLVGYLEQSPDNSFDKFSLSDVASYISKEDFKKLIKEVHRTAKPGARFSIRQFLTNHEIPNNYLNAFKREHDLEENLEKEDRCFVYRFMVGTVHK